MNKYAKMYGWLYESFGEVEFTIYQFKAVFPSPQHAKVIHDLIDSNYLTRIDRGRYKVTEPRDFVRDIIKYSLKQEDVLRKAEKKYAFSDNDAVTIWTEGYYWTGFTKGFKPIHIKVLKKDLSYWKKFFNKNRTDFVLESEKRTLFGVVYILHPVEDLKFEIKDKLLVIPLKETVKFCKANELAYRPALEYIDERYHLNLFKEYEHVH